MQKNWSNKSVQNFGAYNGLQVNFDALNSLHFFNTSGINKFWPRCMVLLLKKRKTRFELIWQNWEYLNLRTWIIASILVKYLIALHLCSSSTWTLKVNSDARSSLGEAEKVKTQIMKIIGRDHFSSLYQSAYWPNRSVTKTFAKCEKSEYWHSSFT